MANTDYFIKGARRFSTTIGVGGVADDSATTVPITTFPSDYSDGDVVAFVVDRVDISGTLTPNNEEVIIGVKSGSNVINCIRGVEGTAQEHNAGKVVEIKLFKSTWNRLIAGLLVEHSQDGTHASTIVKTTATQTLTNKTLTSPVINTGISGTAIVDEDDMVSNSATKVPTQQSVKAYVDSLAGSSKAGLFQNSLINGNFDIWQRGTSFTSATTPANSDDTYLIDRWNLISDGNDAVDVTRDTDKPDGSTYSVKFDTETAKRYGVVQFIENLDTLKLDNKTVSLSFKAKTTSSQVTALRAVVLTWGSTADTVTSDVVGTWGATPTWATNWTAENTPADITITNSWATYTIENIAIDTATVNNIAVVIWTPNEETIGDVWYLSQVQLNEGATAQEYMPKSYAQEFADCKRYYYRWTSVGAGGAQKRFSIGNCATSTLAEFVHPLSVPMRTNPTMTASGSFAILNGTSVIGATSVTLQTAASGNDIACLQVGVASGLDAGEATQLFADSNNTAYLEFIAEL